MHKKQAKAGIQNTELGYYKSSNFGMLPKLGETPLRAVQSVKLVSSDTKNIYNDVKYATTF